MAGIYMEIQNRMNSVAGLMACKESFETKTRSKTSINRFASVILTVFLFQQSYSQDLHFSQWFNSPLTTNPANTGFIPDADYRIGANYRNQYSTVTTVPYKTMSIFGDAQIMRNKIDNGWLGVGGVILRDVAGAGKLTSTKVYGSLAYHQMLGLNTLI